MLDDAPWLGRPVEVDSDQIETLIENNQCDTMWERADIFKISKSIKLFMKMKNLSYFIEKTIRLFWPTQHFQVFPPPSASFWVVLIVCASMSLIFSSVVFNLLLIPSAPFSTSDTIYASGSSIFLFFFFPSPEGILFSLLLQREEGKDRSISVRKKHQLAASCRHLTRDPMRSDQGLNLQPRYVP